MKSSMFMWQDGHHVTTRGRRWLLKAAMVRSPIASAMRGVLSFGLPQQAPGPPMGWAASPAHSRRRARGG
jgi:hypothetical protein